MNKPMTTTYLQGSKEPLESFQNTKLFSLGVRRGRVEKKARKETLNLINPIVPLK